MRSDLSPASMRPSVFALNSLLALFLLLRLGVGELQGQSENRPSVDQQSRTIPSPESVLGFKPGDDFKLATYEESIGSLSGDLLSVSPPGRAIG